MSSTLMSDLVGSLLGTDSSNQLSLARHGAHRHRSL